MKANEFALLIGGQLFMQVPVPPVSNHTLSSIATGTESVSNVSDHLAVEPAPQPLPKQ